MRIIKNDTLDSATPELYRYVDVVVMTSEWGSVPGVDVRLERYPIINETPCGWWIRTSYWQPEEKRWVSKTARRAWAKDTEEKALESYIARKRRQIFIVEDQLDRARAALKIAQEMKNYKSS